MLRRRIVEPLLGLLRQGITPRQLALSLAVGAVLGVFPVLGTTTLLCAAVALALRLNLVAIQVANWVIYPLQFVLLLPFYRAGAKLFADAEFTVSPAALAARFRADFVAALNEFGGATLHAVAAWFLLGLPTALLLYMVLRAALPRLLPARLREAPAA